MIAPLGLGQSGFVDGSIAAVAQPVAPPAWKQVVLHARSDRSTFSAPGL
jgi:hypothetical protein